MAIIVPLEYMEGYLLPVASEATLLFMLGVVLGSFLNVVALNFDDTGGWLRRRHSACPHCQARLHWFELIPLVSYLALMGRCRSCKKPIARSYFWIELVMGLATTGLYLTFYPLYTWWQLIGAVVILSLWMVALLYDARTMMLSDKMLWLTLILALLWRSTFGGMYLVNSLVSAGVAALVLLVIRYAGTVVAKQEAMGAYDALVGAVVGAVVGWPYVIITLFLSFVIGSVYGVVGAWRRKVTIKKSEVPFAPALLVGGYLTWIFGVSVYNWYMGLLL